MKGKSESLIWRGATEILVKKDLEDKLNSGKNLRIKYGIDPTAEKIHIGHAIAMRKLKHFQDLGHEIVLIVGDYTARIGDTSDKDSERPEIEEDQLSKNVESYKRQLSHLFDFSKAEIHFNSEWFDKMSVKEFLKLSQLFSVSQMLDRDNFSKRFESGKRIGIQEFLYPVLQGYDSVAIRADVEIGGNDQLFNILAGRTLQKHFNQEEQNIITYELLVGSDGRKMSKSWGNAVWIDDSPNEMFGKLMTVNDDLIFDYMRLCTDVSDEYLSSFKDRLESADNPRDLKVEMAKEIISIYHDAQAADLAETAFNKQFKEGAIPEDVEEVQVEVGPRGLTDFLVEVGLSESKSKAKRLINQGGVYLNKENIRSEIIDPKDGDILQVGKRNFRKITIK